MRSWVPPSTPHGPDAQGVNDSTTRPPESGAGIVNFAQHRRSMGNLTQFYGLLSGFLASAERFPQRNALVVNNQVFTYSALTQEVGRIASAIVQHEPEASPLGAVLAYRSLTAYSGILGILASGKGYVPLNPKFPAERTRTMLLLSGCRTLVVGKESVGQLPELLSGMDRSLTIILPEVSDVGNLPAQFPIHLFVTSGEMKAPDLSFGRKGSPDDIAYLLFTSGSTGLPKGVAISHSNVCSYVQYASERYGVTESDRLSQEFDQTFDLSVHDMFVCWERGACLFCVPERSVMAPAKFIREHTLTMWFSVPSVIGTLVKLRLLQPGCFPFLRFSLFCGEPLPAAYAQAWQEAAPNSILENLYGPTETTIAISNYRWDSVRSSQECLNGIVPIGWIFDGQRCCLIDHGRNEVDGGQAGELCLSGSQVTTGYWNDPEKTEEQFVHLRGDDAALWYRTGDLVTQDQNGCLFYIGRMDHQVKIRGYRVELQEIEEVVRKACGTDQVVSVPWPSRNGSSDGVVAFVAGLASVDEDRVLAYCSGLLPDYMVPKKIHLLDEMPLNVNGKIDRKRLVQILEEG
jgi:amino acid adenylation domain-containing protein